MFQKVNQMLHLRPRFLLSRIGVSSSRRRLGIRRPLSLFLDAGDVWAAWAPLKGSYLVLVIE
jgi:hypothetical protein